MKPKQLIVLLQTLAISLCGFANNIVVTNVSLTGQNTNNHTVQVQFTISWENSWRVSIGPSNWDAAWVFIKYRQGNGDWGHASLNTDESHIAPPGSDIKTGLLTPDALFDAYTNPGLGVFIFRRTNGNGTFTVSNAQLQWNYGANGLEDNMVVDVQVFAIEQVYVPQGSFAAGDGLSDIFQFTLTTINTSDATERPLGVGSLGGTAGGYPKDQQSPESKFWPNGFNAFYCMKYEISQQGYVDFLNTLSRSQQANRVGTNITNGVTSISNTYVMSNTTIREVRNGIRCDANIHPSRPVTFYCDLDGDGIGGELADGKDIAGNYLIWGDITAYLHWAGLRPMTELEFEKSGRGNLLPIPGEYAWGNTYYIRATTTINFGLPSEMPDKGNVARFGPLRVGSFAGAATTRMQAGAGYYGIMDLTSNLHERPVTIGVGVGRAFLGSHGSGILDATGNATNSDWPAPSTGIGAGFRGGSYYHIEWRWQLSNRDWATLDASSRSDSDVFTYGGRGCRSAP